MPLFLDMHRKVEGVTPEAAAQAHALDVATQGPFGVRYEKYWLDESSGTLFCLVDAPSKEVAEQVHRAAHGMVADEIFEVTEG